MQDTAHTPTLREHADIEREGTWSPSTVAELLGDLLTQHGRALRHHRQLEEALQANEQRIRELVHQIGSLRESRQ
jgi:hypothetical protein